MTGRGLVFAGGAPRSGLTLLRAIVNAHPDIFCGPDSGVSPALPMQWRNFSIQLGELHETYFALPREKVRNNFAKAIRTILLDAPAALSSNVIVEKTPFNVLVFEDLAALLPEAKFIHVVRDGRDVVASLLERDWRNPNTGNPFPHVSDTASAAAYWNGLTQIGFNAENAINNAKRFYVLRYEHLVTHPKRTLRRLFKFINAPSDMRALNFYKQEIPLVAIENDSAARLREPIDSDRVGRWRTRLTLTQQQTINTYANSMLSAFNYE